MMILKFAQMLNTDKQILKRICCFENKNHLVFFIKHILLLLLLVFSPSVFADQPNTSTSQEAYEAEIEVLRTHNYYEVMGVSPDASPEEIKKAFRSRMLKAHPDKKSGSNAQMSYLNEAREVLRDSEKRAEYDRLGHKEYMEKKGRRGGQEPVKRTFFEDIFFSIGMESLSSEPRVVLRDFYRILGIPETASLARIQTAFLWLKYIKNNPVFWNKFENIQQAAQGLGSNFQDTPETRLKRAHLAIEPFYNQELQFFRNKVYKVMQDHQQGRISVSYSSIENPNSGKTTIIRITPETQQTQDQRLRTLEIEALMNSYLRSESLIPSDTFMETLDRLITAYEVTLHINKEAEKEKITLLFTRKQERLHNRIADITQALEVLTDPEKKAEYDELRRAYNIALNDPEKAEELKQLKIQIESSRWADSTSTTDKNLYEILEVPKNASSLRIYLAYQWKLWKWNTPLNLWNQENLLAKEEEILNRNLKENTNNYEEELRKFNRQIYDIQRDYEQTGQRTFRHSEVERFFNAAVEIEFIHKHEDFHEILDKLKRLYKQQNQQQQQQAEELLTKNREGAKTEIQEKEENMHQAYRVLSDPNRRALYDQAQTQFVDATLKLRGSSSLLRGTFWRFSPTYMNFQIFEQHSDGRLFMVSAKGGLYEISSLTEAEKLQEPLQQVFRESPDFVEYEDAVLNRAKPKLGSISTVSVLSDNQTITEFNSDENGNLRSKKQISTHPQFSDTEHYTEYYNEDGKVEKTVQQKTLGDKIAITTKPDGSTFQETFFTDGSRSVEHRDFFGRRLYTDVVSSDQQFQYRINFKESVEGEPLSVEFRGSKGDLQIRSLIIPTKDAAMKVFVLPPNFEVKQGETLQSGETLRIQKTSNDTLGIRFSSSQYAYTLPLNEDHGSKITVEQAISTEASSSENVSARKAPSIVTIPESYYENLSSKSRYEGHFTISETHPERVQTAETAQAKPETSERTAQAQSFSFATRTQGGVRSFGFKELANLSMLEASTLLGDPLKPQEREFLNQRGFTEITMRDGVGAVMFFTAMWLVMARQAGWDSIGDGAQRAPSWEHQMAQMTSSPLGLISFGLFFVGTGLTNTGLSAATRALDKRAFARKQLAKNMLKTGGFVPTADSLYIQRRHRWMKGIQHLRLPLSLSAGMMLHSIAYEFATDPSIKKCTDGLRNPQAQIDYDYLYACEQAYNEWTLDNKIIKYMPQLAALIGAAYVSNLTFKFLAGAVMKGISKSKTLSPWMQKLQKFGKNRAGFAGKALRIGKGGPLHILTAYLFLEFIHGFEPIQNWLHEQNLGEAIANYRSTIEDRMQSIPEEEWLGDNPKEECILRNLPWDLSSGEVLAYIRQGYEGVGGPIDLTLKAVEAFPPLASGLGPAVIQSTLINSTPTQCHARTLFGNIMGHSKSMSEFRQLQWMKFMMSSQSYTRVFTEALSSYELFRNTFNDIHTPDSEWSQSFPLYGVAGLANPSYSQWSESITSAVKVLNENIPENLPFTPPSMDAVLTNSPDEFISTHPAVSLILDHPSKTLLLARDLFQKALDQAQACHSSTEDTENSALESEAEEADTAAVIPTSEESEPKVAESDSTLESTEESTNPDCQLEAERTAAAGIQLLLKFEDRIYRQLTPVQKNHMAKLIQNQQSQNSILSNGLDYSTLPDGMSILTESSQPVVQDIVQDVMGTLRTPLSQSDYYLMAIIHSEIQDITDPLERERKKAEALFELAQVTGTSFQALQYHMEDKAFELKPYPKGGHVFDAENLTRLAFFDDFRNNPYSQEPGVGGIDTSVRTLDSFSNTPMKSMFYNMICGEDLFSFDPEKIDPDTSLEDLVQLLPSVEENDHGNYIFKMPKVAPKPLIPNVDICNLPAPHAFNLRITSNGKTYPNLMGYVLDSIDKDQEWWNAKVQSQYLLITKALEKEYKKIIKKYYLPTVSNGDTAVVMSSEYKAVMSGDAGGPNVAEMQMQVMQSNFEYGVDIIHMPKGSLESMLHEVRFLLEYLDQSFGNVANKEYICKSLNITENGECQEFISNLLTHAFKLKNHSKEEICQSDGITDEALCDDYYATESRKVENTCQMFSLGENSGCSIFLFKERALVLFEEIAQTHREHVKQVENGTSFEEAKISHEQRKEQVLNHETEFNSIVLGIKELLKSPKQLSRYIQYSPNLHQFSNKKWGEMFQRFNNHPHQFYTESGLPGKITAEEGVAVEGQPAPPHVYSVEGTVVSDKFNNQNRANKNMWMLFFSDITRTPEKLTPAVVTAALAEVYAESENGDSLREEISDTSWFQPSPEVVSAFKQMRQELIEESKSALLVETAGEEDTNPLSEETAGEEDTSPLSEEAAAEEYTNPLSEEAAVEEYTRSLSEEAAAEEDTSSLSAKTAVEESTTPVLDYLLANEGWNLEETEFLHNRTKNILESAYAQQNNSNITFEDWLQNKFTQWMTAIFIKNNSIGDDEWDELTGESSGGWLAEVDTCIQNTPQCNFTIFGLKTQSVVVVVKQLRSLFEEMQMLNDQLSLFQKTIFEIEANKEAFEEQKLAEQKEKEEQAQLAENSAEEQTQ